jgi:glyoxylase-like metal-dependent hydrolase (beta-lactamase superfamily II)
MTPGHTPGHVCLYEPEQKFFISGDHILGDISPNITAWPEMEDALGSYLEGLGKVEKMDITLILPGHRNLICHHRQRIAELRKHHEARLQEVRDILKKGAMSAYQVASFMSWDLDYESWDDFPMFQRWFATGEAIAHLKHLLHLKQVQVNKGEVLLFSL